MTYTPEEVQRLNAEFERVKKLNVGSVGLNTGWEEIRQHRQAEWKKYERRCAKEQAKERAKAKAETAEYDRKCAERRAKRAAANTPRNIERSRRSRIDWSELLDNPVTAKRQIQWERRMTALAMHKAGLTYKAIGERLGVTVSRANQLVRHAIWRNEWPDAVSPAEAYMNAELHKEVMDLVPRKVAASIKTDSIITWTGPFIELDRYHALAGYGG